LNFRPEDWSQMQKKIITKTLKDEKGKFFDRINRIYWIVLFFFSPAVDKRRAGENHTALRTWVMRMIEGPLEVCIERELWRCMIC